MDIVSLWEKTLQLIKGEVSTASFNAFFKEIKPLKQISNELIFLAPNEFIQNILENRYLNLIESCVSQLSLKKYQIKFILDEREIQDTNEEHKSNTIKKSYPNLNPKYTFDTFVIGNSNRFAHAACVAVAESPAKAYNPLFLYGGVGLGKTHLMHAIGHHIMCQQEDPKVVYVSSEKFTNELINSIKNDKNEEFRNKYRNVDVLLIDDIQFIIGKESTQEEFFHTFNDLHGSKKQIIISSDKPPKEIQTLEARLRSRFEWGLIADISSPDYETRMAILRKKEEMDGYNIDNDVIEYIATNIKSNIRELEGALNKLMAFSNLEKRQINVALAEEALKDIISPDEKREVTPDLIITMVAEHFHVSVADLKGPKRNAEIVLPRQIAMYLCRTMTNTSLEAVGALMGKKDHSTVINGYKKITEKMKSSESIRNTVEVIQKKISPG